MTMKVRAKIRPWEEIEVSPTEAEDLRRQGSLVEDAPPAPARKTGQLTLFGDDK
jgi:hypothetical protein